MVLEYFPMDHFVTAPCVARFSARGPNSLDPRILKPDITAPGVSIIAAGASAKTPFVLMSGILAQMKLCEW
ncbi:hypothetical protein P8452_62268 [Trifolium repens]|nr:hypothetical protein P8452_62268 [Trifolium repens]